MKHFSLDRLRFWFNRLQERLWVRPMILCVLSVFGAFVAKLADWTDSDEWLPEVTQGSVESLLAVMASSMLTISILAVGSMVAAYTSAGNSATPRSFSLVVSDDVTQNALSAFLGAFIFSLIGLLAVKNDFFEQGGLFAIFAMTLLVFVLVVLTFVRWVDRIARLGRLGNTIAQVEQASMKALERRRLMPYLGGVPQQSGAKPEGLPVYARDIGYLQHVNMASLQKLAEQQEAQVLLAALPGAFMHQRKPLAYVAGVEEDALADFLPAFALGRTRTFEDDPRFGLIVLAEIADKGLASDSNDSGTAIEVINALVRLLSHWVSPLDENEASEPLYDRVTVPCLNIRDLLDDGFTPLARDGAGKLEVAIKLQKSFQALAALGDPALTSEARNHARLAFSRSEKAMSQPEDVAVLREVAAELLD